jgi:hypothetical protein
MKEVYFPFAQTFRGFREAHTILAGIFIGRTKG